MLTIIIFWMARKPCGVCKVEYIFFLLASCVEGKNTHKNYIRLCLQPHNIIKQIIIIILVILFYRMSCIPELLSVKLRCLILLFMCACILLCERKKVSETL